MSRRPPDSDAVSPGPRADDRLESWKEIAAHFDRTVRTVQLWEQKHGMPVHRPAHGSRGIVFAYRSELDAWFGNGRAAGDANGATHPSDPPGRRIARAELWAVAAVIAAALWWGLPASRERRPESDPPRILPLTTDGGYKNHPELSPDARSVAYEWRGDIYVEAVDPGAERLRLTEHEAYDHHPIWSPDGRRIAFVRWLEGGRALHTVPARGGPERKLIDFQDLTTGSRPISAISWSPDGTWLAVVERISETERTRILRLNLATLHLEPLTSPPAHSLGDVGPAISPDGTRVAVIRAGRERFADLDVWIQPVDGGPARRLTRERFVAASDVTWTPDGRSVLVTVWRGVRTGVWRVPLESGVPEPLPGLGRGAAFPSARRGRLVFQRTTAEPLDIWRMPGRLSRHPGRAPERLIASSAIDLVGGYSPDGRRIVFMSDREGGVADIWVSDGEGASPTQLTHVDPGSFAGSARWSPDGRRIAFDSPRGDYVDLYVIDADGGAPRALTRHPSTDVMPAWSRDGRWVYFRSDRSGSRQIWKIPAEGGEPVQVTTRGGEWGLESWDGRHVYYTKTGEPGGPHLIWRARADGGGEEEVLAVEGLVARGLAITRAGLYYLRRLGSAADSGLVAGHAIHFLDLESGHVTKVFEEEGGFIAGLNLSVSPDEEWMLVSKRPLPRSEIVLMENFR